MLSSIFIMNTVFTALIIPLCAMSFVKLDMAVVKVPN